jgi:hypothetical protein
VSASAAAAPSGAFPAPGALRASGSPAPSATAPSRAGSRAGEGRERPGRRQAPESAEGEDSAGTGADAAPEDDGDDGLLDGEEDGAADVVPDVPEAPRETAAVPSAPPPHAEHAKDSVSRTEHPTEPGLQILPLGSGLILVGLGLGLAFVALRVRRGASS